jgi:hypothetical protein
LGDESCRAVRPLAFHTPWELLATNVPALDDDVWELYDTSKDWTQARDLAKEQPQKPHELQRLWLIEAARRNVLPIDERHAERLNSDIAGRPILIKGDTQLLYPGMGHLNENCVVNVKNKSHSVTAEVVVPQGGPMACCSPKATQRRLEPVCQGRQAKVLLQSAWPQTVLHRGQSSYFAR